MLKNVMMIFMNILFIDDNYQMEIKNNMDYDDRKLKDIIDGIEGLGHIVDVLKPNFLLKQIYKKQKFFTDGIYDQNYRVIFNYNFLTPMLLAVKDKIINDVELEKYDVIVATSFFGIMFAEKLKRISLKPTVYILNEFEYKFLTFFFKFLPFKLRLKNAYRYARLIACSSSVIIKKIKKQNPQMRHKLFFAYPCISRDLIISRDNMLEKLKSFNERKQVSIVTSYNIQTKFDLANILKSVEKLDLVNWDLKILYKDSINSKVETLCEKLGILEKVQFVKIENDFELDNIFEEANLFISSDKSKNFIILYLKAMAKGVIPLCYKDTGADGVITNGINGFIINDYKKEFANLLNYICTLDYDVLAKIVSNIHKTVYKYTNERHVLNFTDKLYKIIDIDSQKKC
mgnify:CR=1 FL=1